MPVPASKIRICGSRARTGCITCKSRRVKCDEGRPACARCVKARRECGGYAAERPSKPVQQRHGTSFIVYTDVPKLLSLHAALDYRERGVLDFFHIRAAFDFSTGVAGGLWNRWVPQYAYHESAIHHGLVAVASAHRYYLVLNTCSEDVLDETIKYTMQHYGKAMHATRKLIDSKTEHAPIIASICCVLFSTIESLCGHKQSSVIHLISGLDVLSNCHKALKSDPKLRARYGDIVFDLTRFLFCAGNLVRAMAGNKLAELSCKLDEIHRESEQTEQFDTLAGACASLSDIHSDVTQLRVQMERLRIRSVRNMPPDPTIPPHSALIQKGRELASRYQSFSKTYNAMIEADPSIASAPSLYIGRTVQLCVQCYVTIAVSGTFTSMSYDGFMPQYRQMLYWTRKAIDTLRANVTRLGRQHEPTSSPVSDTDSVSSEEGLLHPLRTLPPEFIDPHFDPMSEGRVPRPEQAPPTFITTTGFLISLAFIVTKCRDPTIRWEAVEILQTCNRREGVWDSRDMAIVAETAVKREEDAARAYWLQKWNESDGEWDQYWPEVVVHEGHGTGKGVEENEAGERRRRRVEVILSRAEHIVQEVRIADLHVMFGPEHGAGLGRD